MLKKTFINNIIVENTFFNAKEQHLFEVEILCNDATFDEFNVSFLNKILSEFSTKTKHFIDLKVLNSGVVASHPFCCLCTFQAK